MNLMSCVTRNQIGKNKKTAKDFLITHGKLLEMREMNLQSLLHDQSVWGGDFASNIATRLVNELKPRCLAMVGICAGWRERAFFAM